MQKNKKNEELQSRREFFKKAAKGALPILTMTILAPAFVTSCSKGCDDCVDSCSDSCITGCKNGCSAGCGSSCNTGCQGNTYVKSTRRCISGKL